MLRGTCWKGDAPWTNVIDDGLLIRLQDDTEERVEMVGGRPNGRSEVFCSGKLTSCSHYLKGVLSGPVQEWFVTGQLYSEARYAAGILSGPYAEWYLNGKLHVRGLYNPGGKEGKWEEWYQTGLKRCEQWYRDGRLLRSDWLESSVPEQRDVIIHRWRTTSPELPYRDRERVVLLLKEGMKRDEIREIVGIPSRETESGEWEYAVWSSPGVLGEGFIVKFDGSNCVTRVERFSWVN